MEAPTFLLTNLKLPGSTCNVTSGNCSETFISRKRPRPSRVRHSSTQGPWLASRDSATTRACRNIATGLRLQNLIQTLICNDHLIGAKRPDNWSGSRCARPRARRPAGAASRHGGGTDRSRRRFHQSRRYPAEIRGPVLVRAHLSASTWCRHRGYSSRALGMPEDEVARLAKEGVVGLG